MYISKRRYDRIGVSSFLCRVWLAKWRRGDHGSLLFRDVDRALLRTVFETTPCVCAPLARVRRTARHVIVDDETYYVYDKLYRVAATVSFTWITSKKYSVNRYPAFVRSMRRRCVFDRPHARHTQTSAVPSLERLFVLIVNDGRRLLNRFSHFGRQRTRVEAPEARTYRDGDYDDNHRSPHTASGSPRTHRTDSRRPTTQSVLYSSGVADL